MTDIKKEVEAILFSAGRVVLLKEFQSLLGLRTPGLVNETIKELTSEYEARESPVMIVAESEGWKLTVKEKYLQIVQKINPHTELSKSILETLAVITWKQPIIQSDVIKIRTNKAYDHIAELEQLGFIAKEKHGRSFALKVTQKFLDYFDLPDNRAIKEVFKDFKDVEVAVQKKVVEFEKAEAELAVQKATSEDKPEEQSGEKATKSGIAEDKSGSVELQPYIDVLPPVKIHKPELQTYEVSPEARVVKGESGSASPVKGKSDSKQQKEKLPEETPEEKARRLAREILGEEAPSVHRHEAEEERKLHPKLEEFIAGSVEKIGQKKPLGKKPAMKKEGEEVRKEEPASKKINAAVDEDEEPLEEDLGDGGEPKPAEEYPGQFGRMKRDE